MSLLLSARRMQNLSIMGYGSIGTACLFSHSLLQSLFGYPIRKKSHSIQLNDFVFRAPQSYIASFLKAYFYCDGTVEESRRAISVTSVSKQMLKDVQLLLLRFGCTSIVQNDTLYVSGLSAKNYLEQIGFAVEKKNKKAQNLVVRVQGNMVTDTVPLSQKQLFSVRKVP